MANENGNIVYLFFFKALWFYGRRSVRSSDVHDTQVISFVFFFMTAKAALPI